MDRRPLLRELLLVGGCRDALRDLRPVPTLARPSLPAPDLGSEIPTPGMNLFVNGGRAGSTSILADGARNTGVGLGRAVVTFSPDTVQEFTVQTSNFSAEFGRVAGGLQNAITRSGSNTVHGSVYLFTRQKFLSSPPFLQAPGTPKPDFSRYNDQSLHDVAQYEMPGRPRFTREEFLRRRDFRKALTKFFADEKPVS